MAYGLVGDMDFTLRRNLSPGYKNKLRKWATRADRYVKRNIGSVPGSIFHHWHGPKRSRAYQTRWKILDECQFDPGSDLITDSQGLHRLNDDGSSRRIKLRDKVRDYFHARNEDSPY